MNTINNFDDALSTFEDFDFDINDSDELIISPTTNNSSTVSESDLVGSDMLFMVDDVTPPFINSSFSVMTKNPSSFLPTMMNNKLDAYAFNPSESAIVKDDESVVSDLYFDSPSTPPLPPPYPKKKRQKIHDHRRVTVDSGAPSLSDLFGNNNNNVSPQVIKKKTTTTKSYHTALKNLAESMKRSQLSRRQVAMQSGQAQDENQAVISSMTKVLSSIEEQLLQHGSSSSPSPSPTIRSGNTSPVFSSSSSVLSDQSSTQNTSSSSFSSSSNYSSMNSLSYDDKSSIMKDFFSGTRNTLTDGLENSRNQLRMLAAQYDCNSYVMKRQSSCLY